MTDIRGTKVRSNSDFTRISLPEPSVPDWWNKPRATSAIPIHLRSCATVPSHSAAAFQALFGAIANDVGANAFVDPYEEAVDDQTEGALPSSPAAMFLSGLNSPNLSTRSDSMSFSSSSRPLIVPPQDEIVAGYRLGPVLGHGAFSVVRRGTSVNPNPSAPVSVVAIKIVRKDDSQPGAGEARKRLANESKIWSQLSHEHILPLFQTVETPDVTFLITLLCPVGSLLDVINAHKADGLEGIGMDEAGMLFRQIVRGLKYLHEVVRLVHGDLKLENVLVDDQGSCRIADFGFARWMHDSPYKEHDVSTESQTPQNESSTLSIHLSLQRTGGRHRRPPSRLSATMPDPTEASAETASPLPQYYFPSGSLPYASPELLTPTKASHIPPPNPAQDIWALGCVLYGLLFGALPFSDSFEPRLQMKILNGAWKLPASYRTSGPGSRIKNRSRSSSASRSRSRRPVTRPQTARNRSGGMKSLASASNLSDVRRPRSKSRGRSASTRTVPQVPLKTIGRVAENVLHGCLCMNVDERWTVAMIDEVGWGVGWDLDVDETGEEYDEELQEEAEAGEMSTSASGSSNASEMTTSTVDEESPRDRFGNRFYVTPSLSPVSETNRLYSSTLDLVTSPTAIRGSASELESLSLAIGPPKAKLQVPTDHGPAEVAPEIAVVADDAAPTSDEGETEAMEKRSGSRGKRGKASRSSSRIAVTVNRLTPSPPTSGSVSPTADMADPFHASREGYVPPSIIPLFPNGSRPTSRPSSRPSSTVPSRTASRERDGSTDMDWPRGRPTNRCSWRVNDGPPTFSPSHLPSSTSCPLPAIHAERSFEEKTSAVVGPSWRHLSEDFESTTSESLSQSPPPLTPDDRHDRLLGPAPTTAVDGGEVAVAGVCQMVSEPVTVHSRVAAP